MSIVKIEHHEYLNDQNIAVGLHQVYVFGINIFNSVSTTTNNDIVTNLKKYKNNKIKGFNNG